MVFKEVIQEEQEVRGQKSESHENYVSVSPGKKLEMPRMAAQAPSPDYIKPEEMTAQVNCLPVCDMFGCFTDFAIAIQV